MSRTSTSTKLPAIDQKRAATSLGHATNLYALDTDDPEGAVPVPTVQKRTVATTLADLLHSHLTTLSLEEMEVTPSHINGIIELIRKHKATLQVISLAGNTGIGAEGTNKFLTQLRAEECPKLHTLNLQKIALGESSVPSICDLIKETPSLSTLVLNSNKIEINGAQLIAECLKRNTTLTSLYLAKNKLRNPGAEALASALDWNTTLVSLDLTATWITDEGIIALGIALAHQPTLRTLSLARNTVSPNGVLGLASLLGKNFTLCECPISGLDTVSSAGLTKILVRNRELRSDNMPRSLQDELSRLYVQKYKLEMATHSLKEHQHQTLSLQDVANKVDTEFTAEKEEISKKAKRTTELTVYEQSSIGELQQRAKDMRAQSEKNTANSTEECEKLQEQLGELVTQREKREAEWGEMSQKLEALRGKTEDRKAELQAQIKATRQERDDLHRQSKESVERAMVVKQQVAELEREAQALGLAAVVVEDPNKPPGAADEKPKPKPKKKGKGKGGGKKGAVGGGGGDEADLFLSDSAPPPSSAGEGAAVDAVAAASGSGSGVVAGPPSTSGSASGKPTPPATPPEAATADP